MVMRLESMWWDRGERFSKDAANTVLIVGAVALAFTPFFFIAYHIIAKAAQILEGENA